LYLYKLNSWNFVIANSRLMYLCSRVAFIVLFLISSLFWRRSLRLVEIDPRVNGNDSNDGVVV